MIFRNPFMWDNPFFLAIAVVIVLALLLIFDQRSTGYVRRFFRAQPPRPPILIDLAAESSAGQDDDRPTWLLLTRAMPDWNADSVAAICARVWGVPVNQDEHDTNFVIGEVPCLMLRHGDWHYLLTIGDEPYMDPEQMPESDDAALRNAFAAHHSWFSLSVVGTPDKETVHGNAALRRSAQLLAELSGALGLVLLGSRETTAWLWTRERMQQFQRGDLQSIASDI